MIGQLDRYLQQALHLRRLRFRAEEQDQPCLPRLGTGKDHFVFGDLSIEDEDICLCEIIHQVELRQGQCSFNISLWTHIKYIYVAIRQRRLNAG